jgi:hypothetical protein
LLSTQPQPLLLFLLANSSRAKVQNRVKSFLFKAPQIRASLPRNELQSLGVKPGPEFERILEQIFALQLDGKIKSHQQLMKELRALAGIKEPPPEPPPSHPPKKTKEAAPPPSMAPAKAGHPVKKGKAPEVAPPPKIAPPAAPPKAAAKPQPAKHAAKPAKHVAKPAKALAKHPEPGKKHKKR